MSSTAGKWHPQGKPNGSLHVLTERRSGSRLPAQGRWAQSCKLEGSSTLSRLSLKAAASRPQRLDFLRHKGELALGREESEDLEAAGAGPGRRAGRVVSLTSAGRCSEKHGEGAQAAGEAEPPQAACGGRVRRDRA